MTHFWPRVPAAIKGTGLTVMPPREGDRRRDIWDKQQEYATRELMFCLECHGPGKTGHVGSRENRPLLRKEPVGL